jgi:two-component system LytT family sensor kinase
LKKVQNRWFWLVPAIVLAAFGGLTWLLQQYGLPYSIAWKDAAISIAHLVGASWIAIITIRGYPTKVGLLVYASIMGLAAGAAAWYSDYKLLSVFIGRTNPGYAAWLEAAQPARLVISTLLCGWLTSLAALLKRMEAIEEQYQQQSDARSLLRDAELFKLRQQLQPHFLYNSLNSINALILMKPEKAQEMVGKLSDFLRNSVKREGREQVPVDEELEYIEAYLAIEAVRFGDRLRLSYDKEFTDSATLPPFLLQPILENAIKFGLYGKTGEVNIELNIHRQGNYLYLVITNPYDRGNKPPSGTGFGLEGIRRRLYLLYGRTDLLETKEETEQFTTTLKIPQDNV